MTAIITRHLYPPIPQRQFDWCAHFDGDEENPSHYGWGPTKAAALTDLAENIIEALCERREFLEAQIDDLRASDEAPTWSQESRIAELLRGVEAIEDQITALDYAIDSAQEAES